MSKREDSSKHTQIALVAAARELFYERGYAAVGTEEIAAKAGVTRGALYHHFEGKAALFEAAFEAVDTDFLMLLVGCMNEVSDPFQKLVVGTRVFFDACLDAKLIRLALLDAPTVLGWSKWREIELKHGLGVIIEVLNAGMATGRFRARPVKPLGHMYFATLIELGMYLGNATDQAAARVEVECLLLAMLESILLPATEE